MGFIAYIITPFFLAGLGALYPSRWIAITVLVAAGAYSTYLLFVGLPTFMRIDNRNTFLYGASTWAVGLLVLVNLKVPMILFWMMALERPTNATPCRAKAMASRKTARRKHREAWTTSAASTNARTSEHHPDEHLDPSFGIMRRSATGVPDARTTQCPCRSLLPTG